MHTVRHPIQISSLKKYSLLLSALVSLFSFNVFAEPSLDELSVKNCQKKIESRKKEYSFEDTNKAFIGDTVAECSDELIRLHNPELLIPYIELLNSPKECGKFDIFCSIGSELSIATNDISNYSLHAVNHKIAASLIKQILSEDEIAIIEEHGALISGIVARNFEKKISDPLEFLKTLTLDLVDEYVVAVFKDFNLEKTHRKSFLDAEKQYYLLSLKKCLSVSKSIKQFYLCVSEFKMFVQPNIGLLALHHFVDSELSAAINSQSYKDSILKKSYKELNICFINFYYNSNYDNLTGFIHKKIITLDRISACVYAGIFKGFDYAILYTLRELNSDKTLSIRSVIDSVNNVCTPLSKFRAKNNTLRTTVNRSRSGEKITYKYRIGHLKHYERLSEETAESFESKLNSCQQDISNKEFLGVARSQIETHPVINRILGENTAQFAIDTSEKYAEVCLEYNDPKSFNLADCENYVFSGAVFDFFETGMQIEITKKVPNIDSKVLAQATSLAQKSVEKCQYDFYKNTINLHKLSRTELIALISVCLKSGVLVAADSLIEYIVNKELSENEVLKKFNLSFGPSKMKALKRDFGQCLSSKIQTNYGDLEVFLDVITSSLGECELKAVKSFAISSLDLLVRRELNSFGLNKDKVKGIINDYKKLNNNIFSRVENADSKDDIFKITEKAESEIISSIGKPTIKLIVQQEGRGLIDKDIENEAVSFASNELNSCLKSNSSSHCSKTVKKKTIRRIIRKTLVRLVDREFKSAASSLIKSPASFKRINISGAMNAGLQKKSHASLLDLIYQLIKGGASLKQVERNSKVRNGIFNVLDKTPGFFYRTAREVIQPRLTSSRTGLAKTIRKAFFTFDFMMATKSSRKAFARSGLFGKGNRGINKGNRYIQKGLYKRQPKAQEAYNLFYRLIKKAIIQQGYMNTKKGKAELAAVEQGMTKLLKKALLSLRKSVNSFERRNHNTERDNK